MQIKTSVELEVNRLVALHFHGQRSFVQPSKHVVNSCLTGRGRGICINILLAELRSQIATPHIALNMGG
jgi:hypothetical protein